MTTDAEAVAHIFLREMKKDGISVTDALVKQHDHPGDVADLADCLEAMAANLRARWGL